MPKKDPDLAFEELEDSGVFEKSRKGKMGYAAARGIQKHGEDLAKKGKIKADTAFLAAALGTAIVTGFHMLSIAIEDAAKTRQGTPPAPPVA